MNATQEVVRLELPITLQHQRLWELRTNILIVFSLTINVCFIVGLALKLVVDKCMANRVKVKGSASTANQYLNKKSGEQFYYASYYMSTVYSIVLTVLTILSWRDCEIDP